MARLELAQPWSREIFIPSTTFAARKLPICGLDFLLAMASCFRLLPSSLYTFPVIRAWLGIAIIRSVKVSPSLTDSTSQISLRAHKLLATNQSLSLLCLPISPHPRKDVIDPKCQRSILRLFRRMSRKMGWKSSTNRRDSKCKSSTRGGLSPLVRLYHNVMMLS